MDFDIKKYLPEPQEFRRALAADRNISFLDIFLRTYLIALRRAIQDLPSSSTIMSLFGGVSSPFIDPDKLTSQGKTALQKNNEEIMAILSHFEEHWVEFIKSCDVTLLAQGMITYQQRKVSLDKETSLTIKMMEEMVKRESQGIRNSPVTDKDVEKFKILCQTQFERYIRDEMGMMVYAQWKPKAAILAETWMGTNLVIGEPAPPTEHDEIFDEILTKYLEDDSSLNIFKDFLDGIDDL